MEIINNTLVDTPVLFKFKAFQKECILIQNPGYMDKWIRGYPTGKEDLDSKNIYRDIATGWLLCKLNDFIKNYNLSKGIWNMRSIGYFDAKVAKAIKNIQFGNTFSSIFKSMDIMIRKLKIEKKVISCYIDLRKGRLVYEFENDVPESGTGMIVFINEIDADYSIED